jgi:hypothetical protein
MKLETILNPLFKSGLSKLMSGDIPMDVAFDLEGIVDGVNSALRRYEKVRQTLLQKYAVKKEDGSFESDENGQAVFLTEEDGKTFFKELEDLAATDVEISRIKLSDLGDLKKTGIKMSVEELKKLKDGILDV